MRPPRVRTHSFPPSIRRIYTSGPCSCRASSCFADLPTFVCLMRFLFVGSVVCRRLPSAHVSRRRPCLWLCAWRYLLHSGLAPIRTRSCRAHKNIRRPRVLRVPADYFEFNGAFVGLFLRTCNEVDQGQRRLKTLFPRLHRNEFAVGVEIMSAREVVGRQNPGR